MKSLGIDWASSAHVAALIDEAGQCLDQWPVEHTGEGMETFLAKLDGYGGTSEIRVGIESGCPLVLDQLLGAGYGVYALNPKQADRFRDRFSAAGAKDDRRDALVLAHAVRTDGSRLHLLERDSDLAEEIRLRDRARSRLVAERTRTMNQLRQTLWRYFPALLELGRELHDPFFIALVRAYPDPASARNAEPVRLQKLIEKHRLRALTAEGLAQSLRAKSFNIPKYVAEACRDEARDLLDQIELLNNKIKAAEVKLGDLFERHPDREFLCSLPGLGERLAVRIVAELGDNRARMRDSSTMRAFAGTAPVTRRSGKCIMSISMRRGCNRELQAALFMAARASVRRSAWAADYYNHLRSRGIRRSMAIRSLSNKWAKILWAVLSTRTVYDEAKHVENLRRHGVPWAVKTVDTSIKKIA